MRSCEDAGLRDFEFFLLLDRFSCLILNENLLLLNFLSFGCLYLGILGFQSEQYFCTLDFCIFNLRRFPRFGCLSLVPTSDITIIIIIISSKITLLSRLCLSGNLQKHNHKRPYDQHNHNHKKMIDHFLMIMIMSVTMTMLLFFIVGTRKS